MTYKANNLTFDINQAIRWYSDVVDYRWKVIIKMYDENVFVGGVVPDISIFGYRERKS